MKERKCKFCDKSYDYGQDTCKHCGAAVELVEKPQPKREVTNNNYSQNIIEAPKKRKYAFVFLAVIILVVAFFVWSNISEKMQIKKEEARQVQLALDKRLSFSPIDGYNFAETNEKENINQNVYIPGKVSEILSLEDGSYALKIEHETGGDWLAIIKTAEDLQPTYVLNDDIIAMLKGKKVNVFGYYNPEMVDGTNFKHVIKMDYIKINSPGADKYKPDDFFNSITVENQIKTKFEESIDKVLLEKGSMYHFTSVPTEAPITVEKSSDNKYKVNITFYGVYSLGTSIPFDLGKDYLCEQEAEYQINRFEAKNPKLAQEISEYTFKFAYENHLNDKGYILVDINKQTGETKAEKHN